MKNLLLVYVFVLVSVQNARRRLGLSWTDAKSGRRHPRTATMRHLWNWLWYRKWTGCRHEQWGPVGFADHRCLGCGAET